MNTLRGKHEEVYSYPAINCESSLTFSLSATEQLQCAPPLLAPSAARSMEDLPAADAPIKVYENTYITKPNDNQR